jgi:decaprenylphospho-beta-D-erythro-pentofuranosid-2-ulose 2-reductase
MNDAFNIPARVALVGGSSEIGTAIAARLIAEGSRELALIGRPSARIEAAKDSLSGAGAQVTVVHWDAGSSGVDAIEGARQVLGGDLDLAIVAVGVLGPADPLAASDAEIEELLAVNVLRAIEATLAAARLMQSQGHGRIVILSSVAAERARADNFAYGATKAALDAVGQGLADRLHGTGVRVLVVRPGFVRTRMTEGMAAAPFATTADAVADAVLEGLRRDAGTVWAPPALRFVMAVLRHLPRPIFRALVARAAATR